jgi:hypothetical protein
MYTALRQVQKLEHALTFYNFLIGLPTEICVEGVAGGGPHFRWKGPIMDGQRCPCTAADEDCDVIVLPRINYK